MWDAFFRQNLELLPSRLPAALRGVSSSLLTDFTAQEYLKLEETLDFLHSLAVREGMAGVHAPGEGLAATRARNLAEGIPVTEATWEKICQLAGE